ncbi:MAG: hypothetical protein ACXWRE_14515 [Pseudobdellovibrionaceae bacterium]
MERRNRTRWSLIIVSLFFIGLAVDYFFLHILFQQKLKEQQPQPRQEESLLREKENSQSNFQASPPHNSTQELPNEFHQEAEKCLGPEMAKNSTPTELIQELEKKNPVQSTRFELENTHIRLPDASMRRLHLIPAENSQGQGGTELRYFSLDEEGLPVRIPLPPEQSFNPKAEFLASLKKQGTVTYHETKEIQTLRDGTTLALTTLNNKIYEFQIFHGGKSFSCREIHCLCR